MSLLIYTESSNTRASLTVRMFIWIFASRFKEEKKAIFNWFSVLLCSWRAREPGTDIHAAEYRRGGHVQPSADDPDAAGGRSQYFNGGCSPAAPGVSYPSQQSSRLPLQQVTNRSLQTSGPALLLCFVRRHVILICSSCGQFKVNFSLVS